MKPLNSDWNELLKKEFGKEYYTNLIEFLKSEYITANIYPSEENIFTALNLTNYKDVRVCILGQDPYHGEGQAHGLSFSVNKGIKIPKSLQNIYKELATDCGCYIPNNGYLTKWADQGVLLLNTVLTVRDGEPNSHKGKGWEIFTDRIITLLNEKPEPIVFILWGKNAQAKDCFITNPQHCVIQSVHPSPLSASRGFFGSKPFSGTNTYLKARGYKEIDWQIENVK